MAAPGGILHKVQLHFEKCIQFTAVSALSFSPVFFPPRWKKRKREKTFPEYICVSSSSRLCIYVEGSSEEFGGLRSHDLSLQKHQKQEHKRARLNSVQTRSGTFPQPFVALRFLLFCWGRCPQQHVNCTICISNRWYPMGLGSKNTSKRRWTIVK